MAKSTIKLADNLKLPLEIAGEAIGILGLRGSGKTNTAGVLTEELLDAGQSVVVIDPTDAWWGLKSSADGKRPGYPVIVFGGEHADVPLEESSGKTIADFLVAERAPAVLSLRHLRKNAQRRFVTEFAEELYHLKGKAANRGSLTVILDEAPLFIPQRVMGEEARCVGAIENLVARGRVSGFGVIMISQRAATINKDVLTQTGTLVVHRMTSPQDRKAISEWFEANCDTSQLKDILASLAGLKKGEAWIWSPANDVMKRAQVRLRHTFDSSATPETGKRAITPKKLAQVDLDKLRKRMATALDEAKANDPKELKKQVATLQRELAAAQKAKPAAAPPAKPKPALTAKERASIDKLFRHIDKNLIDRTNELLKQLPPAITELRSLAGKLVTSGNTNSAPPQPAAIKSVAKSVVKSVGNHATNYAQKHRGNGEAGELSRSELAVLETIAKFPSGAKRSRVAIFSKRSPKSSTFQGAFPELERRGLIVCRGEFYVATDDGLSLVGAEPLPSGPALVPHWMGKLQPSEQKVFQVILDAYPDRITREEVSEVTGQSPKSSTFQGAFPTLRELELIEGRDDFRASELFFE